MVALLNLAIAFYGAVFVIGICGGASAPLGLARAPPSSSVAAAFFSERSALEGAGWDAEGGNRGEGGGVGRGCGVSRSGVGEGDRVPMLLHRGVEGDVCEDGSEAAGEGSRGKGPQRKERVCR